MAAAVSDALGGFLAICKQLGWEMTRLTRNLAVDRESLVEEEFESQ